MGASFFFAIARFHFLEKLVKFGNALTYYPRVTASLNPLLLYL